ncbi:MAG: phospho-N-acetylmuramoyl-pentapeptide-transferase [Candidatus Ventricola sp.]
MQRMMITVIVAFVLGAVIGKLLLPVLHKLKFGQNIYELAPEAHKKKQGTPTMGGLTFAAAGIAATLVMNDYSVPLFENMGLAVLIMAFGNLCIGFADDMTKIRGGKNAGLTPKQKMLFQTILALAFAAYCYVHPQVGSAIKIPFLHAELDLGILYIPVMMFIIVGTTNSANLLDGLDGLLCGVSIIDFATLAILAAAAGLGSLGICCCALAGGCMGFWLRNIFPAQMFMGDTGSMFIGGAVVAAAMLMRQPLILVLIAFWMLMSSLSVIIQVTYFKKTGGKRIFRMSPIHHHFELGGMHEVRIVAMYMTTTVILCLITLLGVL